MLAIHRSKALADIVANCLKTAHIWGLIQISDCCAPIAGDLSRAGLDNTGSNLQQGRFSRSIASDQRNAVACMDRKTGILNERFAPKSEGNVFQS